MVWLFFVEDPQKIAAKLQHTLTNYYLESQRLITWATFNCGLLQGYSGS